MNVDRTVFIDARAEIRRPAYVGVPLCIGGLALNVTVPAGQFLFHEIEDVFRLFPLDQPGQDSPRLRVKINFSLFARRSAHLLAFVVIAVNEVPVFISVPENVFRKFVFFRFEFFDIFFVITRFFKQFRQFVDRLYGRYRKPHAFARAFHSAIVQRIVPVSAAPQHKSPSAETAE